MIEVKVEDKAKRKKLSISYVPQRRFLRQHRQQQEKLLVYNVVHKHTWQELRSFGSFSSFGSIEKQTVFVTNIKQPCFCHKKHLKHRSGNN